MSSRATVGPRSSYDVVVLGASLASVGAGALLARRGFRVLVLGHGTRPETYAYEGMSLRRTLSTVSFHESPAFRRVVAELALVPAVRRRIVPLSPPFQVALPGHRVDALSSHEGLRTELQREFPEVQRPLDDFYAQVEAMRGAVDRAVAADVHWPPEGFWERREASRAVSHLPFGADGRGRDPFLEFSREHPFRTFVEAQQRFAGAMDPDRVATLPLLRQHAAGFQHATLSEGGVDGLRALFEEKVVQHGGDVRLRERVASVSVRDDRVESVSLAGIDESVGCRFVLAATEAAEAFQLTGVQASRAWVRRLLGARPRYHRYVLNLVVEADAIPVGMGRRLYLVSDPQRPLAEENLLALEHGPPDDEGRVVLTVGALLPRALVEEGEALLRRVRQRVLRVLGDFMPFLDRHLRVIDSPHDGIPLEDRRSGVPVTVELRRAPGREPMETLDSFEGESWMGVSGLGSVTETGGLLLVGREVCPGLGVEGEFLAALGAARRVTRTDPGRERMRREFWSKVDV